MELKEKYIDLVRSNFPEVSFDEVTLVTKGWDNDVLILDDKCIFRFPKRENSKKIFVSEVKLLEYLQPGSPVDIPKYEYLAMEEPFGGYLKIKGEEMLPANLQKVEETNQRLIAKQLGDFLTFLHSTPIEVANSAGFYEESDGYWWSQGRTAERYESIKKLLFPKLTRDEVAWISHQFDTYLELKFDFDLTVIHSDFVRDHIFFDGISKITGVIDFADVELGDPALDFTGLWDYGESFVIKVLEHYKGEVDPDFLSRSKFPHLVRRLTSMLKIAQGRTLPVTYENSYRRQRKIIDSGMSL